MKKVLRKKICLISKGIFSLLLIFSPFITCAETKIHLSVAPEMFEWQAKRGQRFSDKIKIYNTSNLPVPIEVSVTNFGAQEETGTITFFEEPVPQEGEDNISYNPRKWIKIKNPNFILDPQEIEKVKFEVTIPENAEPGGHYAVALFEPKLPSHYFEKDVLRAIPKIGVLFLFSVEVEGLTKTEEPLTIVEFNIPEKFHLKRLENFTASLFGLFSQVKAEEQKSFSIVETSHLQLSLSIKNNDIYHIRPEGKLLISAMNNKVVGETEIKETTILPGRIRKFPIDFKPNLPQKIEKYLPVAISSFISKNLLFGKYKAHLHLSVEGGIIEKDIEFWAFPWKFWLSTLFIFSSTLFFVVRHRKRIKLALKILIRRK